MAATSTRTPPPVTPLSRLTRLKRTSTRKSLHHKLAESRRANDGGDAMVDVEGGGRGVCTHICSGKTLMSADYSSIESTSAFFADLILLVSVTEKKRHQLYIN